MLHLIEHLSAAEYWFNGTFVMAGASESKNPLAATGTLLNDNGDLLLKGAYRFAAGSTSHPFTVRFKPPFTQATAVEVAAPHIGNASGHIFSLGDSYELLVIGSNERSIGAHIELEVDQGLGVTGVIASSFGSLGFVATGAPGEERSKLGNVVGIFGDRRG